MKNLIVRTNTVTRFTARLAVIVLFAALISAAPFHAALAQTEPDLATFAVLGGPAVTLTGSTVNGNVGTLGAFAKTGSTVTGDVYQGVAAQPAYNAFLGLYAALRDMPAEFELILPLAGQTLAPGVYYTDGAVTETGGTLTLDAQGDPAAVWIFKIGTDGTGALTGTGFTVVMKDGSQPCPSNVYWWVAEAATLTDSNFLGTIFAGAAITVTGGTFNGNALAKAAVTLTGTTVGCTPWSLPVDDPITPIQLGSLKVTGGGQISVTGGQASFGFNAQPDKKGGAKGHFNYVNHVTGLHVNGTVDNIMVIDINDLDNSPKTVLFSGTWKGGSFSVTVVDNGEPGCNDEFGITVTSATDDLLEFSSQRVISQGNIQFHK